MSKPVINLGTRESQLAMWQAQYVQSVMTSKYPEVDFRIIGMTTMGDNDLIKPLSSFDSKGVFTKELDVALEHKVIDVAVHCLKDLATILPDGQELFAVMDRGNVEDCVLLHPKYFDEFARLKAENKGDVKSVALSMLPEGAVIGTSALRRQACLKRHHPHLITKDIRGNVNTRIAKLEAGTYDAIILARVGLERLGLGERIQEILHVDVYQHAVSQGALCIVGRIGDTYTKEYFFNLLNDVKSQIICTAERGMLEKLQGGCKVPISINSKLFRCTKTRFEEIQTHLAKNSNFMQVDAQDDESAQGHMHMIASAVTSLDATQIAETYVIAYYPKDLAEHVSEAYKLGIQLAEKLILTGADSILYDIRK